MNKVILIGNITADPEMRYTQSGTARTQFNLAVNEKWKDKDGNLQDKTLFVKVTVWGKQAETVAQYVKKGNKVAIDGKLQIQKVEKDGQQTQWYTEVIANHVEFLTPKNGNNGDAFAETAAPANAEPIPDEEVNF